METGEVNREIDQLKQDIAVLRSDMSTLINTLKETGVNRGRDAFDSANRRIRETSTRLRDQAVETQQTVERSIGERPLSSVLTAFGTGFVIGMLMDRHHH